MIGAFNAPAAETDAPYPSNPNIHAMKLSRRRVKRHETSAVRTRILDIATRLFADRGFLGVSLREIMSAADANVASAHYYFGSKDSLYEACVLRYFTTVDAARRERLDAALKQPEAHRDAQLLSILVAYTEPHYELLSHPEGADYVRMIARFLAEPPDAVKRMLVGHFGPTRMTYLAALKALFPGADDATLWRAFSFFVDMMLSAPFDVGYESFVSRAPSDDRATELTRLVTRFGMGGFLATFGE